jgi:hypothetical protein
VRDVDEALSAAMNAQKSIVSRQDSLYDMSIFSNGNQRYQMLFRIATTQSLVAFDRNTSSSDSFQRMPRGSLKDPRHLGSGVGPLTRTASGGSATVCGRYTSCKTCWWPAFSTDLLTALATKLDAAVTSLLGAAGARAEIKLSMLPRESQIRQLLSAVKQIMPNVKGGASAHWSPQAGIGPRLLGNLQATL